MRSVYACHLAVALPTFAAVPGDLPARAGWLPPLLDMAFEAVARPDSILFALSRALFRRSTTVRISGRIAGGS